MNEDQGREHGTTVLVVEDDADYREGLRHILESAGYRVLEAATGAAGLELSGSERPPVVIVDLILPDANGIGICYALKHDRRFAGTKVAALTARSDERARAWALAAGVDAFMVKPSDPEQVIHLVRDLADARESV
ncbi:MAG: response regulator [Actinomycetota bacterium]|nr:response regulator [Actinomycetota bacterium]